MDVAVEITGATRADAPAIAGGEGDATTALRFARDDDAQSQQL